MSSPAPTRRVDPGRRDRIIDACLDVVAREGVAGTSHRRVAAAAGVPLGSMTYHFAGMDELLTEAFTRFADRAADAFDDAVGAAADTAGALAAVVGLIDASRTDARHDAVLTYELYTLAARDRRYRAITERWMRRSRAALERHLDPRTARILDALVEGLVLHRVLAADPTGVTGVPLAGEST